MGGQTDKVIFNHVVNTLVDLDVAHHQLTQCKENKASATSGEAVSIEARTLPVEAMQQLWQKARELTGKEDIGRLVANRTQPAVLKELGLAMLTSKSLGEGLERICRYSRLITTGVEFCLFPVNENSAKGQIAFRICQSDPEVKYSPYAIDFSLFTIARLVRLAASANHLPIVINNHIMKSEACCGVSEIPKEDRLLGELIFHVEDLQKPLLYSDSYLTEFYESQLETRLKLMDQSFTYEVIAFLNQSEDWADKTATDIAEAFNLTLRTFHRRLAKEGTHFSELLQRYKYKLAQEALINKKMSVTETAFMLGYQDVASFSKAFKRWDGKAPSAHQR